MLIEKNFFVSEDEKNFITDHQSHQEEHLKISIPWKLIATSIQKLSIQGARHANNTHLSNYINAYSLRDHPVRCLFFTKSRKERQYFTSNFG